MADIIKRKKHVTSDEVAAVAGVSRWTVNRAFKNESSISAKTRDRVIKAAQELGYVPDLLASSLASSQSNLVALLLDDFANPHKLVVQEVLIKTLRANGFDSMLINTNGEGDTEEAFLTASRRRVDAVILIGSSFNDYILKQARDARHHKKLIVFLRRSNVEDTVPICVNDELAMSTMSVYLAERGYKKPYFIAGPQTNSAHLSRKETFVNWWKANRDMDIEYSSVSAYDFDLAYAHVKRLFENTDRSDLPDVVVCENDILAFGTIDALRYELGLRVPQDIAVTGFDDVPEASRPHYDLTTYKQPLQSMANTLVKVLKGQQSSSAILEFEGELKVRGSA